MKKPRLQFTTPPGVAVYPYLNSPSMTHAKSDTGGVFKVDLAYPADEPILIEGRPIQEVLEKFAQKVRESDWGREKIKRAWGTGFPVSAETEEDDEGYKHETGRVLVKTKLNQYVGAGGRGSGLREQRIKFFDCGGGPNGEPRLIATSDNPAAPKVGGGSILRVSVDAVPFPNTTKDPAVLQITLYIAGVQIIELVEWGQSDPTKSHGMDAVEGGYVAAMSGGSGSAGDDEAEDYEQGDKDVPF